VERQISEQPRLAGTLVGLFLCVALLTSVTSVGAQNKFSLSSTNDQFLKPIFTPHDTPPPAFIPPPVTTIPTPTPIPRIPIVPIVPQLHTNNLPPVNPMDLTRQLIVEGEHTPGPVSALQGIKEVSDFPQADRCKEGTDMLLVRSTNESSFSKTTSYSVDFKSGEIVASLRRPSRLGFVTFALGKIALSADSDVMIKESAGVFRIVNFDGRGEKVKIKLADSVGPDQDAKVIALAPGYELVVGDHVLKRSDIRVADGCARRHFKLLENGKIAVCEISTQSVLTSSAVIYGLKHTEVDRERRILGDMSKMAAVLNYVNGADGFAIESPGHLATK